MRRPMSKVLSGLYIGNILDAQTVFKKNGNKITHVISLRSTPRRILKLYHYLHIPISDEKDANIAQYFSLCNDAIHKARLESKDHSVLVHCYAGISRSATIVIAYLMTAGNLSFDVAWRVLQTVRSSVRPNPEFQQQLRRFQKFGLRAEQRRLYNKFPSNKLQSWDIFRIEALLNQARSSLSDSRISTYRMKSSSSIGKHSDEEEDNFFDCLTGEEVFDENSPTDFNFFKW